MRGRSSICARVGLEKSKGNHGNQCGISTMRGIEGERGTKWKNLKRGQTELDGRFGQFSVRYLGGNFY